MWTPKRVLIWLGGIVLFSTLFVFYTHFLGYIDGFPQLPSEFVRDSKNSVDPLPPPPTGLERILRDAFGDECEELARPIRILLRSKGLAFSTTAFEPQKDDRIKLSPFSAVVYGKVASPGDFPEINTVRSDVAYLTLDKPVASFSEIGSRKIVKIELACTGAGAIHITNNHRTKETSDDISVDIVNAPLFYDDVKNLVWSEGLVKVNDPKTTPPTKITGQGMEIQLGRDNGKGKTGKSDGISGVEKIVLKKTVEMHLYMDPQSGFLADSQNGSDKRQDSAPPPAAAGGEKAHVTIRTDGTFTFDMVRDEAHFECDKDSKGITDVVVSREHKIPAKTTSQYVNDQLFPRYDSKFDEIRCADLLLHFRPKAPAPGTPKKGEQGGDKEIDTALARGPEVKVAMESENLEAFGTEMFFQAATEKSGPQTTIKGQPLMKAVKDGHVIVAPEFHLVGGDKKGFGQHAEAHGAGQIDILDSAHPRKNYTQHAAWTESMSFSKISRNGVLLDLMILKGNERGNGKDNDRGNATFKDDERQQTLSARELFVWLEPAGKTADAGSVPAEATRPTPAPTGPMGSQKLHRLEALRNVTYFSPEMRIEQCEKLIINTRDQEKKAKIAGETLPAAAPAGGKAVPGAAAGPVRGGAAASADPNDDPTKEPPLTKKSAPIQLWAREVRVNVLRGNSQYELENLVAEENVHVIQAGESPKDKGVDIRGHHLSLVQRPLGKILNVDGDDKAADDRKLGRLLMNDMLLVAPRITINQEDNDARGEGRGFLNMPSNSNLDGSKTAKPGSRITVYWNERMEFNGTNASFFGGVQAVQEGNSLRCTELFVTMDKPVSFKEGQKDAQTAKVDTIDCVCGRDAVKNPVFVVERIVDEKTGKLVRQQLGQFVRLKIDNTENDMKGFGPGYVASFSKDSGADPTAAKNSKPVETTKLTRVEFNDRLASVTKDGARKSKFFGNVDVKHLPASSADAVIPDQPPEGGFYMTCQILEIYARPVEGKTKQWMLAKEQVIFRTDKFFCRADTVKFDENDDTVIFEARPGGRVQLTKFLGGGQRDQVEAERILYNRKTSAFTYEGGRRIEGQP